MAPELELLRAEHAPAVLAFELANRAFFARTISDRGEAWFEAFDDQLGSLLADQAAGLGAFYVLVDDDASVVGRFNLELPADHPAVLGYRMAEHLCGRGVATATVRDLCGLAATRHGVRTVRAATAHSNPASQRVLVKAGFVAAGPAEPEAVGGRTGTWWERHLTQPVT